MLCKQFKGTVQGTDWEFFKAVCLEYSQNLPAGRIKVPAR
jgi:hypothetical protein